MKAKRIFQGTSRTNENYNKAIFKHKEGVYYYVTEEMTINAVGEDRLYIDGLEDLCNDPTNQKIYAVKGDEKEMNYQLELDGFRFDEVDWDNFNLNDNEFVSSTDACEEWGIDSSTLRKRIEDFPEGTIRKFGTTYVVTKFGMRFVFGTKEKREIKISESRYNLQVSIHTDKTAKKPYQIYVKMLFNDKKFQERFENVINQNRMFDKLVILVEENKGGFWERVPFKPKFIVKVGTDSDYIKKYGPRVDRIIFPIALSNDLLISDVKGISFDNLEDAEFVRENIESQLNEFLQNQENIYDSI